MNIYLIPGICIATALLMSWRIVWLKGHGRSVSRVLDWGSAFAYSGFGMALAWSLTRAGVVHI